MKLSEEISVYQDGEHLDEIDAETINHWIDYAQRLEAVVDRTVYLVQNGISHETLDEIGRWNLRDYGNE